MAYYGLTKELKRKYDSEKLVSDEDRNKYHSLPNTVRALHKMRKVIKYSVFAIDISQSYGYFLVQRFVLYIHVCLLHLRND